MDPQDEKIREETLHRLLGHSLRLGLAAGGADCPAPDVLAAYFDRSLNPSEALHWESHFSNCARCQQVLAALATSEVEPMTAGEPERVAVAAGATIPLAQPAAARPATQVAPSEPPQEARTLRRYLSWNWLVPAVAAAAALAVWLAVRPARKPATQIARETQAAAPMPQMPLEAPKELAKNLPATPPALAGKMATKAVTPSRSAGSQPVREPYARAASAPPPEGTKALSADAAAGREAAESRSFGIATAPPPARSEEKTKQEPSAQRKAIEVSAAPARTAEPSAESAATLGKLSGAQPGPAVAGAAEQAPKTKALMSVRAAYSSAHVTIATPARAVLWRVGPGGSMGKSRDSGRTWQAQVSNVEADLLAGSAPSEMVCWVVGRAGTILRTTDGERWEKVSSPATEDWIAVKAQDALRARVFAAGGQAYVTADGGKTWQGPAPR